MTVEIIDHPKTEGSLLRIENLGRVMVLTRDEALELYQKLGTELPKMPVKI